MNRFLDKSMVGIINNNVLRTVLKITGICTIIVFMLNMFNEKLYEILIKNEVLMNFGFHKFWNGNIISDFGLYIFAAQIALTVLVGTAVSFVAHLLENKNYGYKIKEIMTYRFSENSKIITDYVFINLFLVGLSIFLLLTMYSEISLIIVLCITLYNTIRVFIEITDIFFNEKYLKEKTILMIKNELDSVKLAQKNEDFDIVSNRNYMKVDSILNRIKEHTIEMLRSDNYEKYIENIDIVCRLGVEIKVSATDDILTSVLYGWFVEKIASYLYENRFDNELFKLTSHSLILKNCNPKFVSIQDRKVAEMYSSHYCQAYLSIQKFNFRIQYTKTPVDFMNTIKSVIEGCNEIYDISSNFSNEIYARMNKNNWSYFILYTFNRIKNDKANLEVNLLQDYISELEKASKKNTWILDILNQM